MHLSVSGQHSVFNRRWGCSGCRPTRTWAGEEEEEEGLCGQGQERGGGDGGGTEEDGKKGVVLVDQDSAPGCIQG